MMLSQADHKTISFSVYIPQSFTRPNVSLKYNCNRLIFPRESEYSATHRSAHRIKLIHQYFSAPDNRSHLPAIRDYIATDPRPLYPP